MHCSIKQKAKVIQLLLSHLKVSGGLSVRTTLAGWSYREQSRMFFIPDMAFHEKKTHALNNNLEFRISNST